MQTSLSIVVPVYNSAATLELLFTRIDAVLQGQINFQLVLVNDYSCDDSDSVCRRLQAEHSKCITYVKLSRNFGEHNAVMAGLHFADGDYCAVLDDDLQNPPEELLVMLAKIREGYDVVYTEFPVKHHSLFRNLGSRFHNWVANLVLDKPADLYLSSFRMMSRFVVQEIIKYTGPDPYIDAIILRSTRRVGKVTVNHHRRSHGRSGYTLGKLISLWGNMFVSCSLYPLRMMIFAGIVLTVIGLLNGIHTWGQLIMPGGGDPNEVDQLAAMSGFFRGLQLLATGLVGEYVGRIYLHINHEPQYVIRYMLPSSDNERRNLHRRSSDAHHTHHRHYGSSSPVRGES